MRRPVPPFPLPGRPLAFPALALTLLLAACGSSPTRSDGPPTGGAAATADAVPRVEPIRPGGPNKPYTVLGRSYTPMSADLPLYEEGLASWYGTKFHGKPTASGEPYDMYAMTAAHRTMPIPSYARVRNPANGREVIVRVNDRGPFDGDRVIDLSWAAAVRLGVQGGVRPVEVRRLTFDEIRAGVKTDGSTGLAAVPPAPGAAAPAAGGDAAAGGFWVQLGAFSRSEGAALLRQQAATELGWLAGRLAVFSEDGVHRVQAGPFASRSQAAEAAERIRQALQLVPVVLERR